MASSSEIEKLERRCAENPHGLTFAPLAEAYRKHGELDRALEVLRAGRELHPDYIPASIVLGRCQLDRGDLPEAERAFAHVLTLDPENVIALKALADLAEREGRGVQAERWLNLLLAVDPSNEEARQQLDRIRETVAPERLVAPEAVPEAGATAVANAADGAQADAGLAEQPLLEQHGSEQPPADEALVRLDEESVGVDEELFRAGDESVGANEELSRAADESVRAGEESVRDDDDSVRVDDAPVRERGADEREDVPVAEPAETSDEPGEPAHAVMSTDSDLGISVEVEDEIVLTPAADSDYRTDVAGALPEAPDAEDERVTYPFEEDADDHGFAADDEEYSPSDAAASGLEPVPDLMSEWGGSGSLDDQSPAESEVVYEGPGESLAPVVTESMAELYLSQGHRSEALGIYRQLLERRPEDGRLAAVVDQLAAEVDTPAPAAREYAAAQTGGLSVADLLRGILTERLPAAPPSAERFADEPPVRAAEEVLADADDQGEPTRPADDHLTLGAVFGEDESGAPPAVADGSHDSGPADGGISFDEFFGPPASEEPDATRSAPPPPTDNPDDLDQFHAWLQSLKR